MLVSSTNKIGVALSVIAFGKSLIYKRYNNGPNVDPCGTAYPFLVQFEIL
jgi:hypothetical protein